MPGPDRNKVASNQNQFTSLSSPLYVGKFHLSLFWVSISLETMLVKILLPPFSALKQQNNHRAVKITTCYELLLHSLSLLLLWSVELHIPTKETHVTVITNCVKQWNKFESACEAVIISANEMNESLFSSCSNTLGVVKLCNLAFTQADYTLCLQNLKSNLEAESA